MERIIIDSMNSLQGLVAGHRVIALCDKRVAELYDLPFEKITVDADEEHKTLAEVERIARQMIAMDAGRDTFLLGIGGGVVCDIAGFVAAVYMRGIKYGLVPTTLLAQADAAIGGKNGVNVDGYKNIIGTIGEPEFVLCDVDFIRTLPSRELRSGLVEIAKAAIIGDAELFGMLESGNFSLQEVVRRAVEVKTSIVSRDRRESGERRLLNLGHTVGHAIEKVQSESKAFCGKQNNLDTTSLSNDNKMCVTHGEAVAVGIVAATRIAVRAEMLASEDAARIENLLVSLGLPISTDTAPETLLNAMRADKKNYTDGIYYVLPTAIGSCTVRQLPLEMLMTGLIY